MLINNLFLLGAADGGRPSKAYYLGYLVTCIIGASRNFCSAAHPVSKPSPTDTQWRKSRCTEGRKGHEDRSGIGFLSCKCPPFA